MTNERKAAIRTYKEHKTRRGIFAIRCAASGEVWVGAAPNLDSVRNSIWFRLRHGHHRDAGLQAAWNAHGEQSLQLTTLEELGEDVPTILVYDVLKQRKQHWITDLGAFSL